MMDGSGAMLAITLEVSVASIIPFLPRGVFDDVATKAMGEAFDAACRALHEGSQPEKVVQDAIARRIIRAARKGVRDVNQLSNAALAGLPRKPAVDDNQRR